MASGYTEHIGLCQWAGTDKFLREEFNGDNLRIDAALGAGQAQVWNLSERLSPIQYNLYNLILQSTYEGKAGAWARGLAFDGFQDASGIAQRSEAITVGAGKLTLDRNGQGNVSLGYGGSKMETSKSTRTHTVSGNGFLTGLRFKLSGNTTAPAVEYTVTVNGVTSAPKSHTWSASPVSEQELTLTLPSPVEVQTGDRVSVGITCYGWYLFYDSDGPAFLGGVLLFTPRSGTAGSVTMQPKSLPAAGGLRAWVRHSAGTVGLAVTDGAGKSRPLTAGESRNVVTMQGVACLEREYRLEEALAAGSWTVKLELSLGAAARMDVYDYGVALV